MGHPTPRNHCFLASLKSHFAKKQSKIKTKRHNKFVRAAAFTTVLLHLFFQPCSAVLPKLSFLKSIQQISTMTIKIPLDTSMDTSPSIAPASTDSNCTDCESISSCSDSSLSDDKDNAGSIKSSCSWANQNIVQPHTGYKKVLVTGGAGFIGSHVAETLLERGDDVVIVDEMNDYYDVNIKETNLNLLRKYNKDGRQRVAIFKGNICDEAFLLDVFEQTQPEWICHMAARAGVRPSIQDPYIYIQSNIVGTTLLMEMAHKFGVKNFVFASSSSVYGGSPSTYFSEDENVDNPVSPYAASKKACELMAYTYHHLYKLNISALRFFTVYGPRGRPDMAPFKFIDRISRSVELQKFGDGTSSRDYTYISDIVNGIIRSIDRPYPYQVFNLGKGNGTSLNEFISIVEKHTNKEAVIRQMPDQPGDVPYTCASVEKAKALLGYEASVPFDEGIRRTVEWYRSAREGKESDELRICPETQANGFGRSPSFAEIVSGATRISISNRVN